MCFTRRPMTRQNNWFFHWLFKMNKATHSDYILDLAISHCIQKGTDGILFSVPGMGQQIIPAKPIGQAKETWKATLPLPSPP